MILKDVDAQRVKSFIYPSQPSLFHVLPVFLKQHTDIVFFLVHSVMKAVMKL